MSRKIGILGRGIFRVRKKGIYFDTMGNSCGVVLGFVVLLPPVETGGYSWETPSEL